MNFEGISSILPVSLVGLIAIGSANSDWPDLVTQATCHGKSNEKQKKISTKIRTKNVWKIHNDKIPGRKLL